MWINLGMPLIKSKKKSVYYLRLCCWGRWCCALLRGRVSWVSEERSIRASAIQSIWNHHGIWPWRSTALHSKHISRTIRGAEFYRTSKFCHVFQRSFPTCSLANRSCRAFVSVIDQSRGCPLSISRSPTRNIRLFDREDARKDRTLSASASATAGTIRHRLSRMHYSSTMDNGSGR